MAKDYKPSQKNREAYTALVPEAELGGLVPPQAVELEEAVLGALMLESDSVTIVQEYISEDSFYTEEHRIIYHAINELATVGKPVDIYTVTEYLKANRQLTKVGGAAYLAKLTQKIGAAANSTPELLPRSMYSASLSPRLWRFSVAHTTVLQMLPSLSALQSRLSCV